MKRLFLLAVLFPLLCCVIYPVTTYAGEKSKTIVNINGAKYYIHTIQAGETLYALSREYDVSVDIIVRNNPETGGGLKVGENIKIPFVVHDLDSASIPDKKLRRKFNQHVVEQGETLYAISRKYEISVSTIIEDNTDIDPIRLTVGSTLLIRKKAAGKTDDRTARQELEQYKDDLNSIAPEGYSYHLVSAGETVYSLSRRFGMTEEELLSINGLKDIRLKAGGIIKVKESDAASQPIEIEVKGDTTTLTQPTDVKDEPKEILFTPLQSYDRLKIALMLPLSIDSKPNCNYLEFYQGFLLGLQNTKIQYGRDVEVTLYNTAHSSEQIKEIMNTPEFEGTNMIVGPVYEDNMATVIEYAENNSIPVISPLANIETINSDVLFQMAPAPEKRYEKIMPIIDGSENITLIYSESTDKEFEEEILALLGNRHYSRHEYRYVHPSYSGAQSPANLTSLLRNEQDKLLIIMSADETDVERILAALSSANTNIVSRGMSAPKYTVLGNSRWNRYNNIDRTIFFKNNVIMISTYHAKRDADIVRKFDSAYIKAFGSMPTLYSYRGYDAAMIFVPAAYDDIQYKMEDRRYVPLQTSYKFGKYGSRLNHINQNWMRVNYNSDFTITVE